MAMLDMPIARFPCRGGLSVAGLLSLLLTWGCNECDFIERCDRDVREVCGGVDQVVNRSVARFPCSSPNPTCVEVDETSAVCTTSSTGCDPRSYVGRCDEEVAFACNATYELEIATDCATVRGDGAPYRCQSASAGSATCAASR